MANLETIEQALEKVKDPEIPVLTIKDLGVLRGLERAEDGSLKVIITPTYSGCPAMYTIEQSIKQVLTRLGEETVTIETRLDPAWTTDWMTEEAKQKLQDFGIAPPEGSSADKRALFGEEKQVTCPHCKSRNTFMKSQFGSTACKSLYQCWDCEEPFDYFKCL